MTFIAHPDVTSDFDALRQSILRRIAPILRAAGLSEHEVSCRIDGVRTRLRVNLALPAVADSVQRALSVRVLDAVHADGRTFGSVSVTFDPVA